MKDMRPRWINYDNVLEEVDNITEGLTGFERNGYFQVNGVTQFTNIEQVSLDDSIFSFKFQNKKLLHFTNLDTLRLILKSKKLRASNLNHFKDKLEVIHALKIAGLSSNEIEESKNYNFAISFTELQEGVDYDYHWTNYANQSKGVALEFQFESYRLPTFFFSLNVNYVKGLNQLKFLSDISNSGMTMTTKKALIPIFSSIKDQEFQLEKEIRLFINSSRSSVETIHYANDDNMEFYLSEKHEFRYFKFVPFYFPSETIIDGGFLRLKRIHLGRNINDGDGALMMAKHISKDCHFNDVDLVVNEI